MNTEHFVALAFAGVLIVYLFAALLAPEKFE